MKLRSGAQVAPIANGGITQNPKTFQTIAQHNASSRFLMLPQEIKNRIYHFVCGGQMVHLLQIDENCNHAHGDDTVELSHVICIEPVSEEKVQEDFDSADSATARWKLAGIENRHAMCHRPAFRKKSFKRKALKANQLSLAHLRCCRQMYLEARSVHYTNNTFAILCNDILERFAKARVQNQQHLAIRSMYLDISILHSSNVEAWSASISKAILRRLKSVRSLHLNMVQLYCDCLDCCGYEGSEMTDRQAEMFMKLRKLPLKKVTMIIDDSDFGLWDADESDLRWTMKQKQEFSKKIREVLLA